jgi:hypothetical protein
MFFSNRSLNAPSNPSRCFEDNSFLLLLLINSNSVHRPDFQLSGSSYQMIRFDVTPFGAEVFRDEPSVAVMGQMFTAKQAAVVKNVGTNRLLNLPLRHQIQKLLLVNTPIAFLLLVGVKDVLGGREFRQVDVFDAADFPEKVGKIVLPGKPGELGSVIQPHVHDTFHARVLELREEITRSSPGESDGEQFNCHNAVVLHWSAGL